MQALLTTEENVLFEAGVKESKREGKQNNTPCHNPCQCGFSA